ncbi:hypothetical protein POVWA1_018850 [Plasmodium ovale wallikeri]|uniref:Uncharacterized protein n=1 Tax=Plasmodium ovale wallikeri TaxID=864142 RepID=A0A1A8YQT8_PLAOA|nr:hypothetical protein POVWA1_018850 [Plasmodium ovale wallikeri]
MCSLLRISERDYINVTQKKKKKGGGGGKVPCDKNRKLRKGSKQEKVATRNLWGKGMGKQQVTHRMGETTHRKGRANGGIAPHFSPSC